MDAPRQFVVALQFDPASHALAVGSRSKDALIVDVTDPTRPTVRHRLTGFTTYVNSVAFSTDGARVVAGSSDNSSARGQPRWHLLAAATSANQVLLWDVSAGLGSPQMIAGLS